MKQIKTIHEQLVAGGDEKTKKQFPRTNCSWALVKKYEKQKQIPFLLGHCFLCLGYYSVSLTNPIFTFTL